MGCQVPGNARSDASEASAHLFLEPWTKCLSFEIWSHLEFKYFLIYLNPKNDLFRQLLLITRLPSPGTVVVPVGPAHHNHHHVTMSSKLKKKLTKMAMGQSSWHGRRPPRVSTWTAEDHAHWSPSRFLKQIPWEEHNSNYWTKLDSNVHAQNVIFQFMLLFLKWFFL